MTNNHLIALLQALMDCEPYLLPERTLEADLNNRLARPITTTEFRALLGEEEGKRRVLSVRSTDGDLKWKITDLGAARLRELR